MASIDAGRSARGFHSVLYPSAAVEAAQRRVDLRDPIHDLLLDRIFDAAYGVLAPLHRAAYERGRQDDDEAWRDSVHATLREYFAMPASDMELARQRQDVARDLDRDDIGVPMRAFQAAMIAMRASLHRSERASGAIEQQGWILDAAQTYCNALEALQAGLDAAPPASLLLRLLGADLTAYRGATEYGEFAQRVASLAAELAAVRYAVRIEGDQVTVLRDPAAQNFSTSVEQTFARFRQADARDYRTHFSVQTTMNHIEAQIVERVALLVPDLFARLDAFCRRHADFADKRWLRLDRELAFYLLWGDFLRRLQSAGVSNCLPELVDDSGSIDVSAATDLALADQMAKSSQTVVGNNFALRGSERMIVVTGPNHGGKTTLARVFGQLHHIASLGLPVAAERARLVFPDRIFTHFERAEDIATQRGKLKDDLVRMRGILGQASARSVVVMNEVFSSTSLDDAIELGRRIMAGLRRIGCCCIFVTFLDELAAFDGSTVSMVALVDPADPTLRTYKIARKPADGRAYAQALAEKYRVTRAWMDRRIAP